MSQRRNGKAFHRRGSRRFFLSAAAAALSLHGAVSAAEPGLEVTTKSGKLAGAAVGESRAFLGVPYAAPPVGKLRWAKPEPSAAWDGVRPASAYASKCPTFNWGPPGPPVGSEDCLYLNVFTPKDAKGPLPVAVWFHGGGFTGGSSQDIDGSAFAAKANVVLVTVNYRLGALGFASLPQLDAESPTHSSGNYALMDQQAALGWVRDNISAFGGDPRRVTAIGESAGAFSIWVHMISPGARGLFQRAITQSGPNSSLSDGVDMIDRSLEQTRGPSSKLAPEFGCDKAPDVLECLRAVPAARLVTSARAAQGWPGWTIILDGEVIPEQPKALRDKGKFAKIPVLSGANEDEGGFFVAGKRLRPGPPTSDEDYAKSLAPVPFGDQILAAYPARKLGDPDRTFASAVSDQWACGTQKINRIFGKLTAVYAFEFADPKAPATLFAFPGAPVGAFHTAEIPYVFQSSYPKEIHRGPPPFDAQQQALSDRMLKAWGDFVWGRKPASDWPEFGKTGETVVLAPGGDAKLTTAAFSAKHNCGFWDTTKFGDWLVNTGSLARK